MKIEQSIHTTVISTSKRKCAIEVSGGSNMFNLKIAPKKRDNGSNAPGTDFYFYTDELDDLIGGLCAFRDNQRNARIVMPEIGNTYEI